MKLILGNGISAKIFAFYNPEYVRVAPEGESQIDKKAFHGCILLHKKKEVKEFLEDLGMKDIRAIKVPIYYYYRNKFVDAMPTDEIMEMFLCKKLQGLARPSSLFPKESMINRTYMQTSMLEVYAINLQEIVDALDRALKDRRWIKVKIVQIGDDIVIPERDSADLAYSHLVSTIPASVFWEIYIGKYKEDKNFYGNSLFLRSMKRSVWENMDYPKFPAEENKILCYFPEKKYSFDRAWMVEEIHGDKIFVESSVPFANAEELKSARLVRNYNNIPPPNVIFLGRYAEWNPDIMVHNVIVRCVRKYLLDSIWSDQKSFNKRFVNFSPDLVYVQQKVKDYILHLISETDSLLNTINWKIQDFSKDSKEVDRAEVLEEWIDIFKFWLSIGMMFGFSVADFEKMYWEKTEKVKERFK